MDASEDRWRSGLKSATQPGLARMSHTPWLDATRDVDGVKFSGHNDHGRLIVTGKGGLCREVSPSHLAARLKETRLDELRTVCESLLNS